MQRATLDKETNVKPEIGNPPTSVNQPACRKTKDIPVLFFFLPKESVRVRAMNETSFDIASVFSQTVMQFGDTAFSLGETLGAVMLAAVCKPHPVFRALLAQCQAPGGK